MFKRRLFDLVPDAMRHVLLTVAAQWAGLVADILLIWAVCTSLAGLAAGDASAGLVGTLSVGALSLALKATSTRVASHQAFAASADVKRLLRRQIFQKVLRLGPDYSREVATAEVVQLAVEGCEQLETYFGQYMPQLFYAVLAPLTLFGALVLLVPAAWAAALVLLVFVPLIPLAIVVVQKVAKRILARYWDEYATLGDSFLENLQGLATLKIYQADEARHQAMDREAEHFRQVTMQVLRMQLNSIIVMDVVALGGAAAGMGLALWLLSTGTLDLFGALMVALLSTDFFRPMRRLGSYFHVAMNGMAASDKIFRLLDLEEPDSGGTDVPTPGDHLHMSHVTFSWDGQRQVLDDVSLDIPSVGITAIVGASGSGKSTTASLLAGHATPRGGQVLLGGKPLGTFAKKDLARYVTVVPTTSYLFAGTVRDNLLMGDPDASEEDQWSALEAVSLADYLRGQGGLETPVAQRGENLSGGQRQRLALARALLHEAPVYILDEATSNIDVESEEAIMDAVRAAARYRAVVLISHRLANVTEARQIFVLDQGRLVGSGTHEELLDSCPTYRLLWDSQQALEHFERAAAPGETAPGEPAPDVAAPVATSGPEPSAAPETEGEADHAQEE